MFVNFFAFHVLFDWWFLVPFFSAATSSSSTSFFLTQYFCRLFMVYVSFYYFLCNSCRKAVYFGEIRYLRAIFIISEIVHKENLIAPLRLLKLLKRYFS